MPQRQTGPTSGLREVMSPAPGSPESRRRARRARRLRRYGLAWLLVAPAGIAYVLFVLRPMAQSVQLSFYDWDGVTQSTWVGLDNYVQVFQNSELYGSIVNAFELIVYFSIIPVALG